MREYEDILTISRALLERCEDRDEIFHKMVVSIDGVMRRLSDETGLPYSCLMAIASDYMKFSLEESLKEVERNVQRTLN